MGITIEAERDRRMDGNKAFMSQTIHEYVELYAYHEDVYVLSYSVKVYLKHIVNQLFIDPTHDSN